MKMRLSTLDCYVFDSMTPDTAFTTMAEKGLPDWVIQAQVRHVAPQMMETYSHVRRITLDQAAAALEPNFPATETRIETVN